MDRSYTTASAVLKIFSFIRNLVIRDLGAPRNIEQLPLYGRIFDSEDILKIKINKLTEKVNYFNNYYIYRTGIGTGEFNTDINIDVREYTDVIDNIYNSIINIINNILIPLKTSNI